MLISSSIQLRRKQYLGVGLKGPELVFSVLAFLTPASSLILKMFADFFPQESAFLAKPLSPCS